VKEKLSLLLHCRTSDNMISEFHSVVSSREGCLSKTFASCPLLHRDVRQDGSPHPTTFTKMTFTRIGRGSLF